MTLSFAKIVKILIKKVHYLVETVDKLSKGKSNFEIVLASQSCAFGKAGLGFNPHNQQDKFSKKNLRKPVKQPIIKSKQPVVTCFYCCLLYTSDAADE